jgi:multiple sugar transport system permease protein
MAMSTQVEGARIKTSKRTGKLSLGSHINNGIVWLLLALVAALEVLPIMWMFSTSLRLPADSYELPPDFLPTAWRWENYLDVLDSTQIDFPLFFLNSLKIALIVTGAQLLTCSMAAFAFARLRFRGRDFLFFMFLASMMVPGQVTTIPLFIIVRNVGLIDSHAALILPALTSAFGIFLLRQFFLTLPAELIDAAKIDGAGFFYIYWRIMLPLIGPGLSALGIFTFLGQWNSFYGPLLYLRSWDKLTLPIGLVILRGYMGDGSPVQILAGVMMSIFPVLVFYLLAQRWVLQGIALTGVKA